MRYLDRYIRIAAENLENELARVARFDDKARGFYESETLRSLLGRIMNGEVSPPSSEFEGFAQILSIDDRHGTNPWAYDLYYKKGEKKLSSAVAALSNLMKLRNDIDFATHCHLLGYTFPDGWPDNPELYAETVHQAQQEAAEQARINAEHARIGFKLKRMWHRFLNKRSV